MITIQNNLSSKQGSNSIHSNLMVKKVLLSSAPIQQHLNYQDSCSFNFKSNTNSIFTVYKLVSVIQKLIASKLARRWLMSIKLR